ncbi:MAG: hypothetical protein NVS3B5_12130 [Sphingomicrobium sp.]
MAEVGKDWLDRADDEWQTDEGQRDSDSEPGECDFHTQRKKLCADQAMISIERRQSDACNRGGQRERQVDHCADEPAAGKAIADQHPGNQCAEHGIDQRCNPRRAKTDFVGGDRALTERRGSELGRSYPRRLEHQRSKRQKHDQRQPCNRQPERQPEPGDDRTTHARSHQAQRWPRRLALGRARQGDGAAQCAFFAMIVSNIPPSAK